MKNDDLLHLPPIVDKKKSDWGWWVGMGAFFLTQAVISALGLGRLDLIIIAVLIGLGVCVYRIAQRIEAHGNRKIFFIICYIVSLAASTTGFGVIRYAIIHMGAEGPYGVARVGGYIAILGTGFALSVTGAIIARAIVKRKRQKE